MPVTGFYPCLFASLNTWVFLAWSFETVAYPSYKSWGQMTLCLDTASSESESSFFSSQFDIWQLLFWFFESFCSCGFKTIPVPRVRHLSHQNKYILMMPFPRLMLLFVLFRMAIKLLFRFCVAIVVFFPQDLLQYFQILHRDSGPTNERLFWTLYFRMRTANSQDLRLLWWCLRSSV